MTHSANVHSSVVSAIKYGYIDLTFETSESTGFQRGAMLRIRTNTRMCPTTYDGDLTARQKCGRLVGGLG